MDAEHYLPRDPCKDEEEPTTRRCKHCGARDLHWEDDNGAWRLVNKHGEIHRCAISRPAKPADFGSIK